MKRFLLKLTLLLAVGYGLLSLFVVLRPEDFYLRNRNDKYLWIRNQSGERFDFVFAGSSRTNDTVEPVMIDELIGSHSINTGVSGGGAADQYLVNRWILENNEVDVFLLQIDFITLSQKFKYPFRDYLWLLFDEDADTREAIEAHVGRWRYLCWRLIPFLPEMEFLSQYWGLSRVGDGKTWDDSNGFRRDELGYEEFKDPEPSIRVPDPLAVRYVHKLLKYCEEKEIEVVLFQSPYTSRVENIDHEECDRVLRQLITDYDLVYWDDSHLFEDDFSIFSDYAHLNGKGADRYSKVIAERLAGR